MQEDLILKIVADTKQLKKDISSATKDKLNIGVDSIPKSMGGGGTDDITRKAMESIQRDQERSAIAQRKQELTGGGGLSDAMSPVISALAPLAVLGLIVSSSGALMASIKQIMRLVQMIVKPIGDLLSVGLMPIIQILKPIGKLFGTMMKPYLMKAREAMRAGGKFMQEGEYGEAAGAYTLGFSYMMKPFFDLMTKSMGEIAKAPLRLMDLFGQGLVALGEKLPVVGDAFKWMGTALSGASTDMMSGVDSATDAIIKFTDDALDHKLGEMLGTLMIKTGNSTTDIIGKFEKMGLNTDALTGGMESSLKVHLESMSGLSESESEKVKSNVLKALGDLSSDADTPMSAFNNTVIGYLEDMKTEADIILGNMSGKSKLQQDIEKRTGKSISRDTPVEEAIKSINEAVKMGKEKKKVSSKAELENLIGSIGNRDWKDVAKSLGYLQTGTKFVPETGLYTLHRGEQVVSNTEKRGGGGSVSFGDINITISGGRGLDENEIASKVKEEIFNELDLRVGG